jgi:hypothetical protein
MPKRFSDKLYGIRPTKIQSSNNQMKYLAYRRIFLVLCPSCYPEYPRTYSTSIAYFTKMESEGRVHEVRWDQVLNRISKDVELNHFETW